jgi:hypothetical protein
LALQVFIGGVEYTNATVGNQLAAIVDYDGFQINEDITTTNKNSTFNLYIFNNLMPPPMGGQECVILNNGVKEFAGIIIGPTEDNPSPGTMLYQVQCKDYEFWFDKRIVTQTYTGATLEIMITDIVANTNLSGAGFTTNHVYPSGVVMSSTKKFDHKQSTEACTELAAYVGFFFYIDYDKDVHFEPVTNTPSPLPNNTLLPDTAEGSAYYNTLEFVEDVSQLRNQIYYIGHKLPQPPQLTQQFTGDGQTLAFDTLYEPKHSLKVADLMVTVDGAVQTNALDISTAMPGTGNAGTVYVYYSNSSFRFASPPADGVLITITYFPMLPALNMFNDPSAVSVMKKRDLLDGVYEYAINDPKMSSTDAALVTMAGMFQLQKYGYPHVTGTFNSFIQGWSIGQCFYLTSNFRMGGRFQNQLFYVVKVTKTLIHSDLAGDNPIVINGTVVENAMQYIITFSDIPFYT